METRKDRYDNPLLERYASAEMARVFSPDFKFSTWRRLWLALAEAEKEEGLPITEGQLSQMREHLDDIDYAFAEAKEREVRHDVMAHVHTFAKAAPSAAPILHLGATSADIGDNTDLIQMREGLKILREKVLGVLWHLRAFARKHRDLPTLGFTHFQSAQPVTVGKRACLWMQELVLDLEDLDHLIERLPFRGIKGTTGTQASFLTLFDGDHAKVDRLDASVTRKAGFARKLSVTGQTYTRKLDYRVLSMLSGLAQSASKFAVDIRLLAHRKEVEEPFEKSQIGSSAMAYKRNPMRCERMTSLARFVIPLADSTAQTAANQWLERTLDDSANKRLSVAQAFLAVDAILEIWQNVGAGLVVYEKMIRRHLDEEMPFMMTEEILMEGVKRGGNRQDLHEVIRELSQKAAQAVKAEGKDNPLLDLIAESPAFPLDRAALAALMDPSRYTGRSAAITDAFLAEVDPLLAGFAPKSVALKV
ncbi:MAG: adenylosuccinate lyase [Spirochaetes bacterium]|nr:adenylosuccinate lyase [Spirochaetota bacterium]